MAKYISQRMMTIATNFFLPILMTTEQQEQ